MKSRLMGIFVLLICAASVAAAQTPSSDILDQCPTDPAHAPYRIFQTKNIWTFIRLDTKTGMVWQVQWGDHTAIVPINSTPLVPQEGAVPGRFTLCATHNIFNFILLDQEGGRMWDIQFSIKDDKDRYISRVE
jgi:hypothetical protein